MKTVEEKKAALHRFMSFIKREPGGEEFAECWIWTGSHGRGRNGLYPSFSFEGRTVSAHRWSYEYLLGVTIGRGNTLDHRCKRPSCVNPVHIRQLTNKENILASSGPSAENARKSHCKNGHALTQGNVATCKRGWRRCRECSSSRERSRRAGGKLGGTAPRSCAKDETGEGGSRRIVSMGRPEDSDPNGDWVILPEDGRGKMLSPLQLRLDGGIDPVGVGGSGLRFKSYSAAYYAAWQMQMKRFKLDWRPLNGKGGKR